MEENDINHQRFNLNEEVKEDQHNETVHSDDNDKSLTLEWSGYNFKRFVILTFVFIFIFGVLIGIEFAYRDPLFDANSDTVSHFQWKSTSFKNFMVALAYLGEAEGVAATLFIFVPILSYSDAMVTLMLMTSVLYLNCIMKVLYHSPRPFWVAGDIHAFQWGKEYGNPSGHAMYIPTVLPFILYLILRQLKLYSNFSSKVILIILIICTTLMALLNRFLI